MYFITKEYYKCKLTITPADKLLAQVLPVVSDTVLTTEIILQILPSYNCMRAIKNLYRDLHFLRIQQFSH